MTQRDYLLRQLETLGALLVAIRNLILGRSTPSELIRVRLREASRQGGMDLDLARASTPDTLRMLIAPTGEVEPGRCWVLAETLYLDGLEAQLSGEIHRARDSLAKSAMLFSLLAPMGAFLVGFPEARERVEEIAGRLEELGERGDAEG